MSHHNTLAGNGRRRNFSKQNVSFFTERPTTYVANYMLKFSRHSPIAVAPEISTADDLLCPETTALRGRVGYYFFKTQLIGRKAAVATSASWHSFTREAVD